MKDVNQVDKIIDSAEVAWRSSPFQVDLILVRFVAIKKFLSCLKRELPVSVF